MKRYLRMNKSFRLWLTSLMIGGFSVIHAQEVEKVTIVAGTKFKASLQTPISSKLSEVGDTVVISILEPIQVDGQHILPRATELTGKITQVKRAGRVKGKAEVYALINELVTSYGSEPIMVSIVTADDFANEEKIKTDEEGKLKSNQDLEDDFGKAAKGASLGSIATTPAAIATSNVEAAIAGPAAGAVAGLLLTRGKEIRLPVGTLFRMKFDKDLTLPISVTQTQKEKH
jgi:hypothetical protein